MDTRKFWDDRKTEMDEDIKTDREWSKVPAVKLDQLRRKLLATEASNTEEIRRLTAEVAKVEEEIEEKFFDEWTKEVTVTRRTGWNERVKRGEFSAKPGLPTVVAVRKAETAQGWTIAALQKAIKHWGI